MSLRSWAPGKSVLTPRGVWSSVANKRMGSPSRASASLNMRVNPGVTVTRPAMVSAGFSASGRVTGLFNWISPSGVNHVLLQDGTAIKDIILGGAETSIFANTLTARNPVFADLDVWAYFCGYDQAGNGVYQAQVFDGVHTDTAFRGPITLTAAMAVDGGAGQCTAGTHYIGFAYQSRSGFTTKPTILLSGSPISVTLNAGLRKINISVTIPALTDGGTNPTGASATLFLIATRADNPNIWYWVPPAAGGNASVEQQPVPLNSPTTLNFVMDIGDEDLAGYTDPISGPNANPDQFLIETQDGSGNGPFNPSFVVPYGTRMCYGAGPTLWISDQNNPQLLRSADSRITMPSQRNMAMAFPLGTSTDLYLTADRWTARVSDNSSTPSTWSQPIAVSDAIGAPFPDCVCYRTGGNYAWIVSERGVDLFTGVYGDKPITYLVQDIWDRVNWAAAYSVKIADDVLHSRVYVGVPLDGAVACSHCLVIDYTNGKTYDTCDITLDNYASGRFMALALVKELNGDTNIWKGLSIAGNIEHFDATKWSEVDSYWESGLVRSVGDFASSMIRVGGADIWMRGVGTPVITFYGPDHVKSWVAPLLSTLAVPTALSTAPGIMYQTRCDLSMVENYSVGFLMPHGGGMEISGFQAYAKLSAFNR